MWSIDQWFPRYNKTDKSLIAKAIECMVLSKEIMLVARKLPILPHLLATPAQPTQLADLLANPPIDQYARKDVATLFTLVET